MTTASQLITRSLRTLGVVTATETPSADDLSAGLDALNDVLAALSLKRGAFPAQSNHALTLTANDGQYSIGSGADLNVPRPLRIESAYITVDGLDIALCVGSREDYNEITDKSETGKPTHVFYDASSANGTVYFYPVPDDACAVNLTCWGEFTQISGVNSAVTLPTYLVAYLRYAVAVALAPEYQRPVDPLWLAMVDSIERDMACLHRPMLKASFDINAPKPYDIEVG